MSVISSLMVKIGADSSGLKKELSNAQAAINSSFDTAAINKFSSHVEQSAKQVEGLIGKVKTFAAVAAAGFGLSSFIKGTAEAGDNLYRLSQRMHITAAEAGMLSKIMSLTGGDVGSLSTSMMRLDKSFTASSEDGEKTRQILSAVGVSLTDTAGRLLPINEQLKFLAEGYKKATAAGYGQEFIMNTLGVRGMALVSTLEQYNEAAEAAGKVKSVGMDPKAMHELNMQLKIMQMEAGQISTAMVLGFGPILQEFLPGIMTGLQQTALFLKANKTEIAVVTKAAVEFYAVMKGISILGKAAASMQAYWASMRVSAVQSTAVEVAASNELTAKQIAKSIIANRKPQNNEQVVEGYSGFLYLDKAGLPLVAMHWQHRMNHMVKRYNDIYKEQMPNITPHVCRHTYCSNMAKSGMNPKTLQYLMGHSDIGVTLNTYTHLGLQDAKDEMERLKDAQKELDKDKVKELPATKTKFRIV